MNQHELSVSLYRNIPVGTLFFNGTYDLSIRAILLTSTNFFLFSNFSNSVRQTERIVGGFFFRLNYGNCLYLIGIFFESLIKQAMK